MFINERVCEGCGDCGKQSNCVAIVPKDTPFGRKRKIDQATCNTDYSCNLGFCPSFVSVIGATPREAGMSMSPKKVMSNPDAPWFSIPEPQAETLKKLNGTLEECNVLICGVGGAGVVTAASILGRAAHIEGLEVSVLDQIGLSQKNGAVVSHIRIARSRAGSGSPRDEHFRKEVSAPRIGPGNATLVLAMDILTACLPASLSTISPTRTSIIANLHAVMPGQFASDPELEFPSKEMLDILALASSESLQSQSTLSQRQGGRSSVAQHRTNAPICDWTWTPSTGHNLSNRIACDFRSLAVEAVDDPQLANAAALGYAFQRGKLPLLSRNSLLAAFEAVVPGKAAAMANRLAFEAGRRASYDPVGFAAILKCSDQLLKMNGEDEKVPWHLACTGTFNLHNQQDFDNDLVDSLRVVEDMIRTRSEFLTAYQSLDYANTYKITLSALRAAEERTCNIWAEFSSNRMSVSSEIDGYKGSRLGDLLLTKAAADGLFRLMAHKDEYEVARLFTDEEFDKSLRNNFIWNHDTNPRGLIFLHLSPPGLSRFLLDPATGSPRKIAMPYRVVRPVLSLLARARRFRGTVWDPLRWTAEHCKARQLLAQFKDDVRLVLSLLHTAETAMRRHNRPADDPLGVPHPLKWYPLAVELLESVGKVRGFGHVRDQALAMYSANRDSILRKLSPGRQPMVGRQ